MSNGLDVSNHQRNLSMADARRSGMEFVYAKSSEGVGYVDPTVDMHLDGAREEGMYAGLYHYCRPDTNSPEADARHFATQLMAREAVGPGSLPPCLDLEQDGPVNMVSWTQRCIAALRDITGYGPILVYANTSWFGAQLGGGGWMDDQTYGWTAHYGREPGDPGFRSNRTVMHQYTSSGRIDGYSGPVDLNVAWIDLSDLANGEAPSGGSGVIDPRPDGWWTVGAGQTLGEIGEAVGIPYRDIASWNGISNPDIISVGQRLRLTPPTDTGGSQTATHTVQAGETLSGIAAQHGTSYQTLADLNRGLIYDSNVIQPGWVLALPSGASSTPEPETYRVAGGDSLSGIAAAQDVAGGWQAIYDANRDVISNPNIIQPGWVLRIPR